MTTPRDIITVVIGAEVLASIGEHAASCAPEEACGVLIGRRSPARWTVRRAVAAPNVATGDRRQAYQVDPQVVVGCLLDAQRAGENVLGFYHAHPAGTATPSARDFAEAWPERVYLIVGQTAAGSFADARCWRRPTGAGAFVEDRLHVSPKPI